MNALSERMAAQYLIRIDDICPSMNWAVWREIEATLVQHSLKPLLAVIPDNRDDTLKQYPAEKHFWGHVRRWRDRGWTIGMHGCQHRYVTEDPGILGIYRRSEFAGLPREMQATKLRMARDIFRRERIEPDIWVAPAHSFDQITLDLLKEIGLRRISDGFFLFPNVDAAGMLWIPQQLWQFRRMPLGVWTVCLHINEWRPRDVVHFRNNIDTYRDSIVAVDDLVAAYGDRPRSREDRIVEIVYPMLLRLLFTPGGWLDHLATQSRPAATRLSTLKTSKRPASRSRTQ
jgi:predicted deacetylase